MTRIKIDYKMELLKPMSVPDRGGSGRCWPSAIAKKNKVPKKQLGSGQIFYLEFTKNIHSSSLDRFHIEMENLSSEKIEEEREIMVLIVATLFGDAQRTHSSLTNFYLHQFNAPFSQVLYLRGAPYCTCDVLLIHKYCTVI